MIVPYSAFPMPRPHLGVPAGQQVHYRPVLPVQISGPGGSQLFDGLVDSGADDTIFPEVVAQRLGIDLSASAPRRVDLVGRAPLMIRYAPLTLRISDGVRETYEWDAVVGFAPLALPRALLGQIGFFDGFDVTLRRARREMEIVPQSGFAGRVLPTP